MKRTDLPRIAYDRELFESFYRDNIQAVQRFVARRVADPHLAADLEAEVFLAAIEAAPSYRPKRGAPSAWLLGITRNVVNAEHRRAAREMRANARISGRRLLDSDDIGRMQERIDAAAYSRELYASLGDLPEEERAVLELCALDELSPRQAAAVLGMNPITARVRLHRARAAMRQRLRPNDTHPPTDSLEAQP